MRTAPANWSSYRSNTLHETEYRLLIGDAVYSEDYIDQDSFEFSRAVLPDDLSLGNVCASSFKATIFPQGTIERAATIKVQSRTVLGSNVTNWLDEGTFFIDNRKEAADGWLTITAYDEVIRKMNAPFVVDGEQDEWPQRMVDVMSSIATMLSVSLDPRNSIPSTYMVEYPNELTIREVIANIAAACGGNAVMTPDNQLYICPLQINSTPVYTVEDPEDITFLGSELTITRVTCIYNENGDYYTAGVDGYELIVDCLWATQQITNDLLSKLNGLTYVPFSLSQNIDPLIELGDTLKYKNKYLYVGTIYRRASNEDYTVITAPTQEAEDHELPYEGALMRQLGKKATLGTKYYGVSITRAKGLTVERVDGEGNVDASVILNANELSFYKGTTRVLYFDPEAQKYKFVGDIILADGVITWENLDPEVQETIEEAEAGITVLLNNNPHVFAGGTDAALSGSATVGILAYKAGTRQAVTIGTISGMPTGMSVTPYGSGTTNPYFVANVTTSLTAQSGELTVPVTCDGVTMSLKWSWSVAYRGSQGPKGDPGDPADVTFQAVNNALGELFKDYNGGSVTVVTGSYIYAPKIKGGEIYGTSIYAGTGTGYAAMTEKGLDIKDPSGNSKLGTGYDTVNNVTYPFLKIGAGSGAASSGAGLVYKLSSGLWVGDGSIAGVGGSYPGGQSSVTDISSSYPHATGLFIDFYNDRIYKYINGVPTAIDVAVFA